MGLVGVTGSLNGLRLAVPRDILRVSVTDRREKPTKHLTQTGGAQIGQR